MYMCSYNSASCLLEQALPRYLDIYLVQAQLLQTAGFDITLTNAPDNLFDFILCVVLVKAFSLFRYFQKEFKPSI